MGHSKDLGAGQRAQLSIQERWRLAVTHSRSLRERKRHVVAAVISGGLAAFVVAVWGRPDDARIEMLIGTFAVLVTIIAAVGEFGVNFLRADSLSRDERLAYLEGIDDELQPLRAKLEELQRVRPLPQLTIGWRGGRSGSGYECFLRVVNEGGAGTFRAQLRIVDAHLGKWHLAQCPLQFEDELTDVHLMRGQAAEAHIGVIHGPAGEKLSFFLHVAYRSLFASSVHWQEEDMDPHPWFDLQITVFTDPPAIDSPVSINYRLERKPVPG